VTRTLASNITYLPSGGMTSFTYGNGLQQSIGYNNRYQINSLSISSIQNLTYSHNANGNITGITNNLDANKNKSYTYDSLNRLTLATGQWGAITYAYNFVSNRTYETTDSGNTTYAYAANRLASTTGQKTFTFSYDADGNTSAENTRQYIYNQNQRLIKAMDGSNVLGEYIYNGKGQRSEKWIPLENKCTIFHYDQQGLLIAESTSAGNIKAEYVYLNGQPLAKIEGNAIYYYHNDHLGTPMLMTDSSGSVVWSGEYLPFGEPLSVSGTITNNLRFPGQYYDSETGLHQNGWRDYKPEIGRYISKDRVDLASLQLPLLLFHDNPLFLDEEIYKKFLFSFSRYYPQTLNRYVFVFDNPVSYIDPTGDFAWIPVTAAILAGIIIIEEVIAPLFIHEEPTLPPHLEPEHPGVTDPTKLPPIGKAPKEPKPRARQCPLPVRVR
jgi:RHS repeat-associated protein